MDEVEAEREREVEELVNERIGLLDTEVDRKYNEQEQENSDETTDDCKAGDGDITVSRDSSGNREIENTLAVKEEQTLESRLALDCSEFYGFKSEEMSDNGKCDNQQEVPVPMEEKEEEVEEYKDNRGILNSNEQEKQTENKFKISREDFDSQNGVIQENSGLGRNKRIRQKNRYFADFHCSDVIKGARNTRDDYDAAISGSLTSGATRSSNRRVTASESKPSDLAEPFETKYCRKCTIKTAHDSDNGCQACLYRNIVESSKRQKNSSQRSRSSKQGSQRNQLDQQIDQSTTPTPSGARRRAGAASSSSNTKSVNRNGRNSSSNNNSGATSPDNNDKFIENNVVINKDSTIPENTNSNLDDNDQRIQSETQNGLDNNNEPLIEQGTTIKQDDVISCDGSASRSNDGSDDLPRLDTWTPDEVAEYIASSGYTDEAQSFRMQDVDGISLLLMQRSDFTYGLKIRLGPALKIYNQVCNLKKEYFRNLTSPI